MQKGKRPSLFKFQTKEVHNTTQNTQNHIRNSKSTSKTSVRQTEPPIHGPPPDYNSSIIVMSVLEKQIHEFILLILVFFRDGVEVLNKTGYLWLLLNVLIQIFNIYTHIKIYMSVVHQL